MRTELLVVLGLLGWTCVVVLVCKLVGVNGRCVGEEPAPEDDPEWVWPVGSPEADVDEAVRGLERAL